MAGMTHEYSKFPEQVMELHNFKDADDSIASIINQIKNLQSQGLYDQAQRIVEQNGDTLKRYVLSTEYLNAIDEETRNVQIYAKTVSQSIFIQNDEPEALLNDVWIGD